MTAPGARTIVCDVAHLAADLGALDALARLQLQARRRGHEIRLRNASRELRQLVAFAGLGEFLGVEMERQTE
jgi:ABC-type transporter Mla MlaB component